MRRTQFLFLSHPPPKAAVEASGCSAIRSSNEWISRGGGHTHTFIIRWVSLDVLQTEIGHWKRSGNLKTEQLQGRSSSQTLNPAGQRKRAKTGRPPYYWPMDGFVVNGTLFIGLLRVAHSEPRGPFSLPFRIIGTDLARIENPNDSPQNWRVRISMLSEDPVFFPGTAFAVQGEHVYAFAFFDRDDGHAPRGLIRLPIEALLDSENVLSERIETFEVNGSWKRGLHAQSAAIVIPSDASEMSVHWNSGRNRWIAVETSPSHTASDPGERGLIRFRESEKLEGPWSTARPLLQIPELQQSRRDTTATNTFCYAAKAHSQYSKTDELIITYVCNLYARSPEEGYMVLEELTHRPDLYRPRVVRVSLPPVDRGSH